MDFGLFEIKFKMKSPKPKYTTDQLRNRCHWNQQGCLEAERFLGHAIEFSEIDNETGRSEHFHVIEGLLIAAITTYGRQFVKNRGGDNAAPIYKLDPHEAFNNDKNKIALHELIQVKRNKIVAHDDSDHKITNLIPLNDPIREKMKEKDVVARRSTSVNYFDGIDLKLFKEIAHNAEQYFIRLSAFGEIE